MIINPFRYYWPPSLFAAGEQGAWYDPAEFSTLFQDSAGATPVTAVEQAVGLMLDKSKGLVSAAVTVTNGGFDADSDWTKGTGWSIGSGVATKSAGTAANLTQTIATTTGQWYRVTATLTRTAGGITVSLGTSGTTSGSVTAAGTYTWYILAGSSTQTLTFAADASFAGTVDNVSVNSVSGNHAYQTTSTSRPTLRARVNQYLNTATLATQNATTVAANYTLRFEGTGSVTLSGTATGTYSAGTHTITCTAGTLTSTVSGTVTNADLRVANDGVGIPAYQRVTSATDYDTAGFPVYLDFCESFGGTNTDNSLLTNSIDFSGTDKMTVFAGVRKLSDAAQSILYELSADTFSNNGAFLLWAPSGAAAANYYARVRGSLVSNAVTLASYAAPITNVATMLADIAGDSVNVRLNQVSAATSTSDLGTGNFGNYPLYIGRRNNASLPASMRLYSLIVRGATTSDAQIAAIEAWVNSRARAY